MKTTKLILLFAIVMIGGICNTLQAQKKIEALIDSCENVPNIDKTVLIRYNDNSGDLEYVSKSMYLNMNKNKKLSERFFQVFEEEEKNCKNIARKILDGKVVTAIYMFTEGNFKTTCMYTRSDSSKVMISFVMEKNE